MTGNFMVSYSRLSDPKYSMSTTKNISKGGMCLTTSEMLKENTRLIFVIKGPFALEGVELLGITKESREVLRDSIYNTRVKFLESSEQRLDSLDKYIKERLV